MPNIYQQFDEIWVVKLATFGPCRHRGTGLHADDADREQRAQAPAVRSRWLGISLLGLKECVQATVFENITRHFDKIGNMSAARF